jgi:hypothetical protein
VADLSDVESAIVSELIGALYPNGTASASAVGVTCRVYRGWPVPTALNSDLAGNITNITVFPSITPDQVPEAYFDRPYGNISPVGLNASVTGQNVTLSGIVSENLTVGLIVDGVPYTYGTNAGDTVESVAANLRVAVLVDRVAILSGATLLIPNTISLIARIVANVNVSLSLRRQRKEIQICCWCPSTSLRDSVCTLVDLALVSSPFIRTSDGTKAHVQYVSTQVYDQSQNALLYRRDLCYRFEYTMIGNSLAPVMLFGDLVTNGSRSYL